MSNIPAHVASPSAREREAASRPVGVRGLSLASVAAYVLLFALTMYFLTPLYWLTLAATKDNTDLFGSFGLWFAHFNLWQNLVETFTHDNSSYPRWLANTVLYAGAGGLGSTLISIMGGYALSKYRFRGRNLIFGLVLGAVLVPQTTLALPLYMVESKVNLTNTYWAVLFPTLLSPVGVLLARIFVNDAVPNELLDAARVDGAGELRVFARVAVPLLVPGMITIFLFQFVAIWNNFFLPLIVLSDPKLYPVNVGLVNWNFDPASHTVLYNLIVTGSFVAVLPLVVLFLFLQRYWRAGLAFGSMTG
ncbi:MAG TPA: carbohydrate ABC transporter permease [Ktedonobacterales bacterium]